MRFGRSPLMVAVTLVGGLAPAPLAAQVVRYEVSVAPSRSHLFRVKAEFPTGGRDTLYVSLPAWSPGNYEIQNYARYVRHFGATTTTGQPLFWDRFDKKTWRVTTGSQDRVTVTFDYLADTIDLSLARLTTDFGQFLGTNLFLYEPGKLDRPAEVRFALPAGWQVTTALKGSGGVYSAADYHELADAQTFVGKFSVDSIKVEGKWIRIALWPGEFYTAAVARNMRAALGKIAQTQDRLMGGPPYDTYTVFFNVIREPISFGGGLEHTASQYDIMPMMAFADPAGNLGDFMAPLMAHEYFHLWNVKRVRPAAMWPYDYSTEQYTPLLWWSEGVTDYYADLTNLRSGLWTDEAFLNNTNSDIQQVEQAPEPWSQEDGGVATWIDEVFVNSSQLYYPKGALTGMLLDISIRDATDNARSLDDVMRALYTRHYQKGQGFTTEQLLALLREFGMPDVDGFYQRFINGREPLPYETVFPKAGISVAKTVTSVPFLGVVAPPLDDGKVVVQLVEPGSAASLAGVTPGDELLKIGEVDAQSAEDWSQVFRRRYQGQAGAPLTITVQRGNQTMALATKVQERSSTAFSLSRTATPTAKQTKLWQGLAGAATGR